jgi:hypothetical protein
LSEVKRMSLVKPTLETCFHIDFDWWQKNDQDWRVYLRSNLCPEHQKIFLDRNFDDQVDWVDPQTAEVQRVEGMQHILITHCAKQPGFIQDHSALVDAAFRVFLANGNQPLNSIELGERLNRPPVTILKTLSGLRVYKGIRPCLTQ